MIRNRLQSVGLALYRRLAAAGLLDRPWVRAAYERTYLVYKALIEAGSVTLLRQWVRPNTSVIDVGANVGFFTVRFARWTSGEGKVFALEPEILNYQRLRRTLARSKVDTRVEAIQMAAAEVTGEVLLQINPYNPADHRLGSSGIRVPATTIDDLLREQGWPVVSLIKIDVQGAEPRVLEGARETIVKFRPAIFVEIHDESLRRSGATARELLQSCLSLGYSLRVLSRGAVSGALTTGEVLALEERYGYVDVLLLPSEISGSR